MDGYELLQASENLSIYKQIDYDYNTCEENQNG